MKSNILLKKKSVSFYTNFYCNIKDLGNKDLLADPLNLKFIKYDLFSSGLFLLYLDNKYYELNCKYFENKDHITIVEINEEEAKKLLIKD